MRQLNVIPIVHSQGELGSLREVATTLKSRVFSPESIRLTTVTVDVFWDEIWTGIQAWDLNWSSTFVYQDALPSGGAENSALIKMIVDDLATQGSRNHQILQWIMAQGGQLLGTELPELLIEEYNLVKQSMGLVLAADDQLERIAEIAELQTALLKRRDRYIADRVDSTLIESGVGLIFLGLLHSLEDKLPKDISVSYPFGKPMHVGIS